ncbi:nucleoside triphosphate pyrophosphohydrolase [Turicibacter sp. TJ11]|uniref:nucleoside triphosphate pyrophosphohydrolase n=1 Tax=Turicibacter sp. TJ11 TaxID=2806443 RepID=UPI001F312CA6|nr:nucleoside triphosphate pyrophosphohydrolase [Turicibacter sp. TJ11]
MKTYDKLVRDLIPEIIETSGKTATIEVVNNEVAFDYLLKKLDEEVSEFKTDQNLEELADVMEVLFGLAHKLGYSEQDLLTKRQEKKQARGGFEKNIILKSTK